MIQKRVERKAIRLEGEFWSMKVLYFVLITPCFRAFINLRELKQDMTHNLWIPIKDRLKGVLVACHIIDYKSSLSRIFIFRTKCW